MGERPKTVLAKQLNEQDAQAFDAFVRQSPFAACQQTRAWAESAPGAGRHDYFYFLCRQNGETIGAAIVRRSRLAPGAALATVQRGPVVAEPGDLDVVIDALKSALRSTGFCTLILGPRAAGEARQPVAEALARCGLRPLPPASQSLHTVTGTIALAGSENDILARFKQRGRRAIRKVEASGVTVRLAAEADLSACGALLAAFHARRPDYDSAGQLGVDAQARLIAREGGAILVAEQAGRLVGWHSFVRQGQNALWLGLATDDDAQAPRSYLLLWEAMRTARAMGLEAYDLAGLAAQGEESGRDQFKQAFAPEREELVPAHVASLRPLRHALFFGARQAYRSWRRGRRDK